MTTKLNINLEKVKKSRINDVDFNSLVFGKTFSDHMFVVNYDDGQWGEPKIMPFQSLSFNPSMATLHYGQSVFEGMKAYKNKEGEVLVFRPEEHARRFNESASRVCIPELPEELFLEGLNALLEIDKDWVPQDSGSSLYIRPVAFATDEALGVAPCKKYSFLIFASPVSSYYQGAVKVIIEKDFVRAAEGGTGYAKTAGNYAASLYPALQAQKKGYDQLIWTDAKEHKYIEEAGTMNVMFQVDGKLITPETSSSILAGITRKSVIALAKKWGVPIEERKITVDEIVKAYKEGKLEDAFGTGTAATISHIALIGLDGEDMVLPPVEERGFSNKVQDYLSKLKVGEAEDYMSWMTKL